MGAFSGAINPMIRGININTIKMARMYRNPFKIRFSTVLIFILSILKLPISPVGGL
jgi:hypothetical protein